MLRSTRTLGRLTIVAGLTQRASVVIKAKLSKLIGRAEDPAEQLDYSYEQQLRLLQNVKRGIADVVTSKKRLQLQTSKLEQELVKLEDQARQALAAGREDLARQALERKTAAQQQLRSLDEQVAQLERHRRADGGHRAGDPARAREDGGHAGSSLRRRRADRSRHARGLHVGPVAARPRARPDLVVARGGRRARAPQG